MGGKRILEQAIEFEGMKRILLIIIAIIYTI